MALPFRLCSRNPIPIVQSSREHERASYPVWYFTYRPHDDYCCCIIITIRERALFVFTVERVIIVDLSRSVMSISRARESSRSRFFFFVCVKIALFESTRGGVIVFFLFFTRIKWPRRTLYYKTAHRHPSRRCRFSRKIIKVSSATSLLNHCEMAKQGSHAKRAQTNQSQIQLEL